MPILYYHRIKAPPADFAKWSAAAKRQFIAYDVIPAAFEAQLDWLLANGYTTILPRDLAAYWDHGLPLPDRPVIISFDDGSRSWVTTVLPLLRARGMVAEFYLTLDAIEHGNLTWTQVRRLARYGNGIGAHDVHHVQLTAFRNGRAAGVERRRCGPRSAGRAGSSASTSACSRIRWRTSAAATTPRSSSWSATPATRRRVASSAAAPSGRASGSRCGSPGSASHDDVVNLVAGTLVPGLPRFTARMGGTFAEPEDPPVDADDGCLD